MGFVASSTKIMMGVVNLTFALMGMALVIVGGLVLFHTMDYQEMIEHGFFSIPALLMIIGSIVAFVFCFGGVAAFKKSYCMMMLFTIIIALVLVLEVGGLIAAALLRGKTEQYFETSLKENFKRNNDTKNQELWNDLQSGLQCCGTDGYTDYMSLLKKPVPESCCMPEYVNCTTSDVTKIFQKGCGVQLKDILVNNLGLIIQWTAVVVVIHFVWVCMGGYLTKSFRRGGYESV